MGNLFPKIFLNMKGLVFMKNIVFLTAVLVLLLVSQTVYAGDYTYNYDEWVLGDNMVSWTDNGVGVWKLPETDPFETKVYSYHIRLYKDDAVITTEQAISVSTEWETIRGTYDFRDIMKEKGEGAYKFSVKSDWDNEEYMSEEYFYTENTFSKISDFQIKSNKIYISGPRGATIPYGWQYAPKKDSKIKLVETKSYPLYYYSIENDKIPPAGGTSAEQYLFTAAEAGEEEIVFVYSGFDDVPLSLKFIVFKCKIDKDLNAEIVSIEERDPVFGDANGDGALTSVDAALVFKKAVNEDFVTPIEKKYGEKIGKGLINVNLDSIINVNDAVCIMEKILNGSEAMPIEERAKEDGKFGIMGFDY